MVQTRIGGFDPCYIFKNDSISTELTECKKFEFLVEKPTMITQVCRAARLTTPIFNNPQFYQWSLVCNRGILVNVVQLFYLLGIFLGGMVTFLLLKKKVVTIVVSNIM
jgi:hypothetical protein